MKDIYIKKEDRRRTARNKRKIHQAKTLFRAVDVLCDNAQNRCPYVKKNDRKRIYTLRDIVYERSHADVCRLDYYRVPTDRISPSVMIIHGGGFTAGDKKYRRALSQWFALNGFAVFCVNYGLAPEYVFPKSLEHLVAAGNYIAENADKYRIDKNRMLVCGDSAGAYFAAMLAALSSSDKLRSALGIVPEFEVHGALLNCGVYDLGTALSAKSPLDIIGSVIVSFAGVNAADLDTYAYRDACMAADYVTSEYPKSFLIYSGADMFCKGHTEVMLEKLAACGVEHDSYKAKSKLSNHCFSLTWRSKDAVQANTRMMNFAKYAAFGEKYCK